jgi:hypothetical protein
VLGTEAQAVVLALGIAAAVYLSTMIVVLIAVVVRERRGGHGSGRHRKQHKL